MLRDFDEEEDHDPEGRWSRELNERGFALALRDQLRYEFGDGLRFQRDFEIVVLSLATYLGADPDEHLIMMARWCFLNPKKFGPAWSEFGIGRLEGLRFAKGRLEDGESCVVLCGRWIVEVPSK